MVCCVNGSDIESPHRILATLGAIAEVFGDRPVVVARELTKKFEEVVTAPAAAHADRLTTAGARGEFTLVIPHRNPAPTETDRGTDRV